MSIICSPLRSRLAIPRLSNLLFASLVGPPLNEFCPMTYVKKWLLSHRASHDNQSKKVADLDNTDVRYSHMISMFL